MAMTANPRERATLLAILLLAASPAAFLENRADGQISVWNGPRGDPTPATAGDLYIVNNTNATISFSVSPMKPQNPFNTTTISPYGVAASTDLNLYGSGAPSNFQIQGPAPVPACSFTIYADIPSSDLLPTTWMISGDSSFTSGGGGDPWTPIPSPGGAYTYVGYVAMQILNDYYVVTLAVYQGDDSTKVLSGTKILVLISRNAPAPMYQYPASL